MNFQKSFFLLFIMSLVSIRLLGQSTTDKSALLDFSIKQSAAFNSAKNNALKIAKQRNIPVILETSDNYMELMFFSENGNPQYYTTNNNNASATISTNDVNSGGGHGYSLDGTGMTVHEWDAGGVLTTHQEYVNRVTQGDNASSTHYHSTHVAGTLIASGVAANAKGMAPSASLRAFDWNNADSEMATEASAGALVSNHSYGFGRGWANGYWYGDPSISTQEDYLFGFYDSYSAAWDEIANDAPYYLIVKSAGNDRNDCGDGSYPCDGPYDCIGQLGVSKNILTVGAVSDIPGGYTQPSDVVMSSFSSWGPVDDGRIKPDLVTNGVGLYSTKNISNTDYATYSGTSMAAPSAAGSLILLQEHYQDINGTGTFMTSATLKALVIHTADEAGDADGPDYEFGWGLMNTRKAAEKISEDDDINVIDELNLSNNSTYQRTVKASGSVPLQVTIVWTDEPGTPVSPALDPTDVMLVNDLDLKITSSSNTYYPWKLDGSNPQTAATHNGENNVDNVEMVTIDTPVAGDNYTIIIDHDGSLTDGSQNFSIIISGINQPGLMFFNEDWESQNGTSQNNGSIYSTSDYAWTFETNQPNSGRVRWGTNAHQVNNGSGALTMDKFPGSGTNAINAAILTLDLSNYTSSTNLELEFWWADHNDEEQTADKVWVRGTPSDNWVEIYDFDAASSTDNIYQLVTQLDIDELLVQASPLQIVSDSFQVKFGQSDNEATPNDGISIDDISIFVDHCYSPSGLVATNITSNSADLSWTEIGAAESWELLIGTAGFDTTGLTPVAVTNISYNWTGLSANTAYEWYVRSNCSASEQSDWSYPHSFITGFCESLSPATLPFIENWESDNGSLVIDGPVMCGNTNSWVFQTDSQNNGRLRWGSNSYMSHNGNGAMTMDRNTSGTYAINFTTLTLNLSQYINSSDLTLSFWWTDHSDEEHVNDKVWARGSDADEWVEVYDFDPAAFPNGTFNSVYGIDIDSILSASSQTVSSSFQLRFGQEDNFSAPSDGLTIDDISLTGSFSTEICNAPSELNVSNITTSSAELSWTENGIAAVWDMRFGPAGFDTSGVTPVSVNENPLTVDSLEDLTTYEWYIRAACGNGNFSDWTGPESFSTIGYTRKLPYIIYNGNNTQMEVHWQLHESLLSTFEWGTDTTYGTSVDNSEFGDDHQHMYLFTGLSNSTKYYYRVSNGNESFAGSFLSAPGSNAENISFFVYGDHRTFPERHDSIAHQILEIMNVPGEEQGFILSTGDLVSDGDLEAHWDEQLFNTGFTNISNMMASLPFIGTMGNHENDGIFFSKYLSYPFPDGGGSDGNYWSFDYGNVHISVIDQYVDYSVGSDQYNWLVNDLSFSNKTWKIISLHEPGWSAGYYDNNTDVQTLLQPLCEIYDVQIVFAGHNHYYARAVTNEINHITTGGGASNLYDVDTTYPNVVFAEKAYHFCKVDISGNTLRLISIDRDGDTIDDFSLSIAPDTTMGVQPIAHWPVDEGSGYIAADISGNSNDGSLQYGTSWTAGKFGSALSFDGIDDRVDCGNSGILDMGAGDFTISAWVKMGSSQASYPTILGKGAGASYDPGYWLIVRSGRIWLYISDGNTRAITYSNIVGVTDNEWHHLAAVVNRNGDITYYVDGIESGTFDISAFDGVNIVSSKSLTCGKWQASASTVFNGDLDEIKLFDEALNSSEINDLFIGVSGENNAPVILASASVNPETITMPDSTIAQVSAFDPDGDTLTYSWEKLSGPGDINFTPNNTSEASTTKVSFTMSGSYSLRVFIYDNSDTVISDVDITVLDIGSAPAAIGHWPMDEGAGTVTTDLSANGNDGSLLNGAGWADGHFGSAVSFDGVNDKVDCGNSATMDMGTEDFTISTWVKMDASQNTFPTVLGKGAGASYDAGYWMVVRSGRIWFYISDGTSRVSSYSSVISINDDTWHHLAVVIDRDANITFYVDNVESGTFDISVFNGTAINSSKSLTIGMWQGNGSTALEGDIDDVKLFDVALSSMQVDLLFTGSPGGNHPPVILTAASVNPDPVTLPDSTLAEVLAYDPDGDTLNYAWIKASGPGDVDFTPNNSPDASTTMTSFSLSGIYTLRVYVFDNADTVSSDVSINVLDAGSGPAAVAHWPMDEGTGTTTADISGNGNNGTLLYGANWASGISSYAVSFDGLNDKIDCGNSSTLDMGTGDFTISTWVNMDNTQASYPTVIGKGAGAAYDIGYWLTVRSNRIWLYISDGNSRLITYSDIISVNDEIWHHLAATIDRDDVVTFYVDGNESGTFNISSFDGLNIISTKPATIGIWQQSTSTAFEGEIDEVSLYNSSLSAAEISSLYELYSDNKMANALLKASFGDLQIYPNPFTGSATIGFFLSYDQHIIISVYDMHGNRINVLKDADMFAGQQSINWNGQDGLSQKLPPGIYVLRIVGENNIEQKTIVKMK